MENNNNNTLHFKLLPVLKVNFTQAKMQDFSPKINTAEGIGLRELPLKSSSLPSGVKSHGPAPFILSTDSGATKSSSHSDTHLPLVSLSGQWRAFSFSSSHQRQASALPSPRDKSDPTAATCVLPSRTLSQAAQQGDFWGMKGA